MNSPITQASKASRLSAIASTTDTEWSLNYQELTLDDWEKMRGAAVALMAHQEREYGDSPGPAKRESVVNQLCGIFQVPEFATGVRVAVGFLVDTLCKVAKNPSGLVSDLQSLKRRKNMCRLLTTCLRLRKKRAS